MVKQIKRKKVDGTTYTRWVIDAWVTMPGDERIRIRKDIPEKQAKTRAEALSWAQQYIDSLSKATTKSYASPRLVDFWHRYLNGYCKANNNRASTLRTKVNCFKTHIQPYFGTKKLLDIKKKELEDFKLHMVKKGSSTSLTNLCMVLLTSMLRYAEEQEVIVGVPKVKFLKSSKCGPPPHFTDSEMVMILDAIKTFHNNSTKYGDVKEVETTMRTLILLCADAGLRLGEATALKWKNVEDSTHILVKESMDPVTRVCGPTKSGKGRRIPVTHRLKRHLTSIRGTAKDADFVVAEQLTTKELRMRLHNIYEDAGITGSGAFHRLRHTFATRLIRKNVNIRIVKELCGHTDIHTTMRYTHVDEDAMDGAIGQLNGGTP